MDGAHDLGGKQGFGPIEVETDFVAFHEPWQARGWAITRSTFQSDWTLDWWRHVRELIDPVDYLSRHYFDSWLQLQTAALIDSGALTLEEAVTGKAAGPAVDFDAMTPETPAEIASKPAYFDRPLDSAPAYQPGDAIRTRSTGATGHCRLPGYAQGRQGRIHAYHGAHIFADDSAKGDEHPDHIYSVVFEASELWPEAKGHRDRVFIDLWEAYLEPA